MVSDRASTASMWCAGCRCWAWCCITSTCASIWRGTNWLEGHHGYLPGNWDVLWSLSVEETFYLGFPLCCVALRSHKLLLIPLVGLIAAGPLSRMLLRGQVPWEDYAYLSCMDGIAWGCVAALGAARLPAATVWRRICLLGGTAATALVIVFRGLTASLGLTALGLNVTLLQLGIAAMMIGLAGGNPVHALSRASGFIRVIGRSSYEIYLTHMFVVLGAAQLVRQVGFDRSRVGLWYLAELLGSIALGYLVARLFSAPANRFLRTRYSRSR